jgi:hypothetical protein
MSPHLNIGEAIVEFSVEVAYTGDARVRRDIITTATCPNESKKNEASRILKSSSTRPAAIVWLVFVHM